MQIEHNIPLPKTRRSRWMNMINVRKGDSFAVSISKRQCVYAFAKKNGIKITTSQIDDFSVRVWREN